ncbi:MAG: DUF6567 family protein [Candidatus Latescibacterota bacterium]|jgi:hypothetical protein
MKRYGIAAVLLLAAVGLSGCAQTGVFASANLTEVQLNQANYQVIATDVAGKATAGYLLGLSFPAGMANQTLAVARIEGTGMLYREALADLWARFEAEHGPVAGRRLALVNVRYDSDNTNLLLYTKPRLSIRADVVEFGD